MIISAKKILELNKKYHIIENLSERERLNPEGVGIDLRVGEVYRMKNEAGYLGVDTRKTPSTEKVADISNKAIKISPGEFVLVKTMEKINLPSEKIVIGKKNKSLIIADVHPRTTLFRSGIHLMVSKVDPGYQGELTFGLANLGKNLFELELGSRIANVIFVQVHGDLVRAYAGQWKGGRVAASKREKQN